MECSLSVITPVYNGEAFIEACLLNVIDQACPEAEHLVMDGGSRDRTLEIVQRYAAHHPHIRWVSAKDHGQSHAMNQGIAMARGSVIGFLNHDDYYEPGVLRKAVLGFKTLPDPAFLVGDCRVWDERGRIVRIIRPRRLTQKKLLLGFRNYEFPANPSAYFYHKSLHAAVGAYDEANHLNMDLDFLIRALPHGVFRYVPQVWGNFRLIPGSKTHTVTNVLGRTGDYDGPLLDYYRRRLGAPDRFKLIILFCVYFVIRFYKWLFHRKLRFS